MHTPTGTLTLVLGRSAVSKADNHANRDRNESDVIWYVEREGEGIAHGAAVFLQGDDETGIVSGCYVLECRRAASNNLFCAANADFESAQVELAGEVLPLGFERNNYGACHLGPLVVVYALKQAVLQAEATDCLGVCLVPI